VLKSLKFVGEEKTAQAALQAAVQMFTGQCRGCNVGQTHTVDFFVQDGRVIKFEGNDKNPENYGTLCDRGLQMKQLLYSPDRIIYPMKRVGDRGSGQWQRISWDQAFTEIAAKIQDITARFPPAQYPHYMILITGHATSVTQSISSANSLLTAYFGPAVRNDICFGPQQFGSNATHGPAKAWSPTSVAYGFFIREDWDYTKLMVLWAHNKCETFPQMGAHMLFSKWKMNTPLVVVDPVLTPTGAKADIWLHQRPATDSYLTLGIIHVIIKEGLWNKDFVDNYTIGFDKLKEEAMKWPPELVERYTWVPARLIKRFAREYATNPAILTMGRGGARSGYDANWMHGRGVASLIHLCGQSGERGRGMDFETGSAPPGPLDSKGRTNLEFEKHYTHTRHPVWDFWDRSFGLLPGGTWKILWQLGEDYLSSRPDADILQKVMVEGTELILANELFISATPVYADYLLPVAFTAEMNALSGGGYERTIASPECIPRAGEVKSDYEIAYELIAKMDPEYSAEIPWKTDKDLADAMLTGLNTTFDELLTKPEGVVGPNSWNKPGHISWGERKFPTPSGKVEFYSDYLKSLGLPSVLTGVENQISPLSTPEIYKKYPYISQALLREVWFYCNFFYKGAPESSRPVSSWIREASPYGETMEPCVNVNPETAEKIGAGQWDWVWVESPKGRRKYRAVIAPWVDKRLLMISLGWRALHNQHVQAQLFMRVHPELRSQLLTNSLITHPGYSATLMNIEKVKEGE
jgi:anaerobic selenocysteine-containing dehydrogenase